MNSIFVLAFFIASAAAMPEPVMCTNEINPTCGLDGVVYNNPCLARKLSGGTQECAKERRSPIRCPMHVEPNVCGLDGVQYSNSCLADLATGGHQPCSAANKRSVVCKCPRNWAPVCDRTTNIQYPNSCVANECNGVIPTNLNQGECSTTT